MKRIAVLLPLLIMALVTLAWITPSQTPAKTIELPAPTATQTLPPCVTEDGAGMALCFWDADTMGNGIGTDVISGDCAPDYVGGQAVSDLCVELHKRNSETIDMGDGFSKTIPNGADLVAECVSENNLMSDSDKRKNGFTLEECFKAQMHN